MATPTPTSSETPTTTPTPTITPTNPVVYQFQDCYNDSNIFRFGGALPALVMGSTYYISGGYDFVGCATVVTQNGGGELYESTGVIFTLVPNCGSSVCTPPKRSAVLSKCGVGTLLNALVNESEVFVGASYLYNGECYQFVQFAECPDDIICPDLGSPDYDGCEYCVPTPTPTPTPNPTPSITPTISPTPQVCGYSTFCLSTSFPSLSAYSGTYTVSSVYNGRLSYVGDGSSVGYIYYFTSVTESYWCLSSSLGGTCLIRGASPCYSVCPDLSSNIFTDGVCPPPDPPDPDCTIFDFESYFDCNYQVTPTPTPSVNCNVVDFNILLVTPTPTSTKFCYEKTIDYDVTNTTPTPTPTVTPTSTSAIQRNVSIGGNATYQIFSEQFSCVPTKILSDCSTGEQFYTNDSLVYNGVPLVSGTTFSALINGLYRCVKYLKDDQNLSSNSSVDQIVSVYGNCNQCVVPVATPTPTPTTSVTPTLTPTPTQTPDVGLVYVYESCSPIGTNTKPTQIVQTKASTIVGKPEQIFKDLNGVCWKYNGKYSNDYIAPENVFVINFEGNYFENTPSQDPFVTCEECETFKTTYEINRTNDCETSLSSYLISGGTTGDKVAVRARFVGQLKKLSGNYTRAELYLTGSDCDKSIISTCYSDNDYYSFDIYTDCTITMGSDKTSLTTVADFVNSSSTGVGVVTVSIISVNNKLVSGISANGCKNSVFRVGNC